MRLFAAVPVTDPAREQVRHLLAELRRTSWPVRWVRDEGVHLTLKFFGDVPAQRLSAVTEAVGAAASGTPPLPMALGELGTYPARGPARVLWLGLEGPPALELLQDRLERRAEAIGFPVDGRPFHPHITLGRVRDNANLPARMVANFPARFDATSFVGERVVLYESTLGPGGSRYEPRFTVELRA